MSEARAISVEAVRSQGLRCKVVPWSNIYDTSIPTRYGLETKVAGRRVFVSEAGALLLRDSEREAVEAAAAEVCHG